MNKPESAPVALLSKKRKLANSDITNVWQPELKAQFWQAIL